MTGDDGLFVLISLFCLIGVGYQKEWGRELLAGVVEVWREIRAGNRIALPE